MAFNLDNIPVPEKTVSPNRDNTSFLKREITLFNSTFSNKIKEDFYAEMSVLLKAGVTLKDALDLLKNSQKKLKNKNVLQSISDSIISGESLSDAIRAHKQFTDYEYHSIKIGEETGTLTQVTQQLGDFYARKNEQKRQLISALTYPVIILSTAVLVVVFMLNYVLG